MIDKFDIFMAVTFVVAIICRRIWRKLEGD